MEAPCLLILLPALDPFSLFRFMIYAGLYTIPSSSFGSCWGSLNGSSILASGLCFALNFSGDFSFFGDEVILLSKLVFCTLFWSGEVSPVSLPSFKGLLVFTSVYCLVSLVCALYRELRLAITAPSLSSN